MQSGLATPALPTLLAGGVLTLCRIGGLVAFAPPFRGGNIPLRIRALFAMAVSWLVAPAAIGMAHAHVYFSAAAVGCETLFGLLLGLALSMLTEAVLFAGTLMSMSFSFSLGNMLDPNSQVDTTVLSTLLNWLSTLVLLGAGLHRVILRAVLHSFASLPLGTVAASGSGAHLLVEAASGIFFGGLQLAAPVLAGALLVEIAVGLVGRIAPGMPAHVLSVPLKTCVSYLSLIASLALWPGWIERHVSALLDLAQQAVRL